MGLVYKQRFNTMMLGAILIACSLVVLIDTAYGAPTSTDTVVLSRLSAPDVRSYADEGSPDQEGVPSAGYPGPSFYTDGATVYPSDGSSYSQPAGPNPLVGRGPHGGYDTSTDKCGVCHSAHSASSDNYALLRAGVTGCEYCHLGSTVASGKSVYTSNNGDPSSVGSGNSGHEVRTHDSIPASTRVGEFSLRCSTCHAVHGSDNQIWKPSDFYQDPDVATPIADSSAVIGYKLLRKNPSRSTDASGTVVWEGSVVPTSSAPGASSPTTDTATVNQFALSYWCANCHDKGTFVPDTTPHASTESTFTVSAESTATHKTDGPTAPHVNPKLGIYNGPTQCYTCHRGGLTAVPLGLDPASPLLTKLGASGTIYSQNAVTDSEKVKCSRCHYGTADFAVDTARISGTSDWPHSSSGDVALLGNWTLDASDPYSAEATSSISYGGAITADNKKQYVCGRCHPTSDGSLFWVSYHAQAHTYLDSGDSWSTTDTISIFDTIFSPGF